MKIKINRKNLLEAAALCAKLVIPSKSPLESLPNLRLAASTKLHTTELLASNGAETVMATVIDSHPESDCDPLINSIALTTLLKSVDSEKVTLDIHDRQMDIYLDNYPAGTLTASNAAGGPVAPKVPKDAEAFILPSNIATLMKTAFKFAALESESRPAITGVNLSSYGVTATDGQVLYNVPAPMQIKGSLTLPKAVLPTSIGNMPLTMKTWGRHEYEIRGIGFSLYGRGLDFAYPDLTMFIEENPAYTGKFTLKGDLSAFKGFLRKTPNQEVIVTVRQKSLLVKSWIGDFELPADSSCTHGTVLHMAGDNLLSAVELGHTEIQFGDSRRLPIRATGGKGVFLFLRLKDEEADNVNKDSNSSNTNLENINKKDNTASRETEGTTAADKQSKTTQEKEKTQMTQTTAITRINTTPQSQTQTQAQPKSALDELEQFYNGLKETQALYNDQLAAFGRKIKLAALAYRQQARAYNKAVGRLKPVRKIV